jgi:hypothetical protein
MKWLVVSGNKPCYISERGEILPGAANLNLPDVSSLTEMIY